MNHSDPPNLPTQQKCPKIDFCSTWGGALTDFLCKLRLKIFFSALGGAGAHTALPDYAYGIYVTVRIYAGGHLLLCVLLFASTCISIPNA